MSWWIPIQYRPGKYGSVLWETLLARHGKDDVKRGTRSTRILKRIESPGASPSRDGMGFDGSSSFERADEGRGWQLRIEEERSYAAGFNCICLRVNWAD